MTVYLAFVAASRFAASNFCWASKEKPERTSISLILNVLLGCSWRGFLSAIGR
jgi:hypothetical protein